MENDFIVIAILIAGVVAAAVGAWFGWAASEEDGLAVRLAWCAVGAILGFSFAVGIPAFAIDTTKTATQSLQKGIRRDTTSWRLRKSVDDY